MIAYLRGQLMENSGEAIVVDVGGVGYQVLDQRRDAGQSAGGRRRAAAARPLALHQGRAAAPLRLRRRRRAPPLRDADRRAGRRAARRAGDPGRAARRRAGARHRRRRRRAPDADQGRGAQDRRAARRRAARQDRGAADGRARRLAAAVAAAASSAPTGPLGDVYGALVALGYKPAEFEALAGTRWTDATDRRAGARRRWPRCRGDRRWRASGTTMARRRTSDGPGAPDPGERVARAPGRQPAAPADEDAALRPRSFAEFVGQRKVADNLAVYVQAARQRGDALDHVLLSGPPGLGKTTLAYLLGHEMGTEVRVTSGPALERKGDLAGILTSLGRGRHPVHRRDPPPAAGRRGEPLPGDGGLPHRARDRRRRRRARHPARRSSASRWWARPRAPGS